jgi:16S rRNA U1498 N3-methylase RsmE
MSNSDEIKVTDQEAREWAANLSDADKQELKRQALLKRAIELTEPPKQVDWGSLSEGEFQAELRKLKVGG